MLFCIILTAHGKFSSGRGRMEHLIVNDSRGMAFQGEGVFNGEEFLSRLVGDRYLSLWAKQQYCVVLPWQNFQFGHYQPAMSRNKTRKALAPDDRDKGWHVFCSQGGVGRDGFDLLSIVSEFVQPVR